jgi:outer membrane murein-binding lipoprotein Lpp
MTCKTLLAAVAVGAALFGAGCGDDDGATTTTGATTEAPSLAAVKDYLVDHTAQLRAATAALRENAARYDALADSAGYDYAKLLETKRSQVNALVKAGQETFAKANPAYEQMEGVVAGVPSLADYDVIIDAGSDKSDPANAVPFSIKTEDGRTFEQPGNFNFLVETALFGTEPKWAAKGVEPDLDGDGTVEFGEALPDAQFDAAARAYKPTLQDAMTALVVMTPTMSEYFEAWKNSRFVAGAKSTEKAFVVASRLQDITDILGGLVVVYGQVHPAIAKVDAAQARQTGTDLVALRDFAAKLERTERGGKTFTAQDADTLGGQAQDRAEAIAGQVSQAAGRLNVKLEN